MKLAFIVLLFFCSETALSNECLGPRLPNGHFLSIDSDLDCSGSFGRHFYLVNPLSLQLGEGVADLYSVVPLYEWKEWRLE